MTLMQIAIVLTLYSGLLIVTYPIYAPKRGLPVGEILANESGIVRTLGGLGMLFSLIAMFFHFDWYIAIINIIGIFIASFLTTSIFKKAAQSICILGIFIGYGLIMVNYIF